VIAVGAVDKQFALAEFSSRGSSNPGHHLFDKPNCVAPGVMITAARSAVGDGQYDRPYVSMSGTGMATPVVAGSAAYLISHALRDSSREDARERTKTGLLSTASKQLLDGNNDELYEVGQGLIDIRASLDAIL
jgi:subtilisin family serine protease